MRPELEQLARIDAYVNKSMNAAERAAFEVEMQTNAAVQEAVQMQQLLVTAINRKALMAHVAAAAAPPPTVPPRDGSFLSNFKWPIVLSSIVVGAVISWFAFNSSSEETEQNHEHLYQTPPSAQQAIVPNNSKVDSLIAQEVAFTYEPTRTTSIKPTYQRTFGGLETWVAPTVQEVVVDPAKEELVQCTDGTLILVPEKAFADADGNPIAEPVTLEIIEALTMDKMVAYNLSTMSDGKALKSGGMIYIQPSFNGTELQLAEGKSLHIEIPTNAYDPNMKAWQGVADDNGNLNWENPQEIENYLIPVSMSSLEFLPDGFREEVAATLPFKNYTSSSRQLEDSLYYALNAILPPYEQDEVKEPVVKPKLFANMRGRENRKTKPKENPIQEGVAIVQFNNLPDEGTYVASYYMGKIRVTDTLINNQIRSDFLGTRSVSLTREGCPPVAFSDVEFISGTLTELECGQWNCDFTPGSGGGITANYFQNLTNAVKSNSLTCYLDPSTVKALRASDFENTFIATREFQERLQALHKIKNGQTLLNMYIRGLEKNMHEIDAEVAGELTGDDKVVFEKFAAQKLTNVKPDGQEFDRLKKFYSQEVKKQKNQVAKQQRDYAKKSAEELQRAQQEISNLRAEYEEDQRRVRRRYNDTPSAVQNSNSVSAVPPRPRRIVRNPRPSVANQSSYKVNWFGTGWVNIDSYLHLLSKGEKRIPIVASKRGDTKIYQSVNSLNTLLSLNDTGNGYEAHFPVRQSPEFVRSLALGVSRNDGKLKLAAKFFNPYAAKAIALDTWEEVSEDEFKRRLKELYPGGQHMLNGLEQKERQIKAAMERQQRAEERRQLMEDELSDLDKAYKTASAKLNAHEQAIRKQQAAERSYLQHLIDFVNPCTDVTPSAPSKASAQNNNSSSIQVINPIGSNTAEVVPNVWDVGPEYVGGFNAMNTFISENIQYPQEAIDQGIAGKVYLQVTLDNLGKIQEVEVLRSDPKSTLLENEAVRVVMAMPNWTPATRGEVFVASRTTFPVNFVLD